MQISRTSPDMKINVKCNGNYKEIELYDSIQYLEAAEANLQCFSTRRWYKNPVFFDLCMNNLNKFLTEMDKINAKLDVANQCPAIHSRYVGISETIKTLNMAGSKTGGLNYEDKVGLAKTLIIGFYNAIEDMYDWLVSLKEAFGKKFAIDRHHTHMKGETFPFIQKATTTKLFVAIFFALFAYQYFGGGGDWYPSLKTVMLQIFNNHTITFKNLETIGISIFYSAPSGAAILLATIFSFSAVRGHIRKWRVFRIYDRMLYQFLKFLSNL